MGFKAEFGRCRSNNIDIGIQTFRSTGALPFDVGNMTGP